MPTEDFLYHLYRASALLEDGAAREAMAEVENALAHEPNDPRARELQERARSRAALVGGVPPGGGGYPTARSFRAPSSPPSSASPSQVPASSPSGTPAPPAVAPLLASGANATYGVSLRSLAPAAGGAPGLLTELSLRGPGPGADPNGRAPGANPNGRAPGPDPNGRAPGADPNGRAPGADPNGKAPGADRDVRAGFNVRVDAIRAFTVDLGALVERDERERTLLGGATHPFVQATGPGRLLLSPRSAHRIETLQVAREQPLFVREDALVAFDRALTHASAKVGDLQVVQLQGDGHVLVEAIAALRRVRVEVDEPMSVRADRALVGWMGRLLAHAPSADEAPLGLRGLLRFTSPGTSGGTSAGGNIARHAPIAHLLLALG